MTVGQTADIRVMIVDDHGVVRDGLKTYLAEAEDLEVVGEAADGAEAVLECRRLDPDVVLMDLVMPVMDGAAATARIRDANPAVKVIALTSFAADDLVQRALDAGAISYLLKDTRPEAIPTAVRDAYEGKGTIDGKAMQAVLRRQGGQAPGWDLTRREREVLGFLVKGMTNEEIAEALILSVATIRLHVSNVLMKLHAGNRTTAAVIAVENRLV
jgi:two-component system, NarL family, response regulator LiaR